jgi:preprotein translocase subunit SecG
MDFISGTKNTGSSAGIGSSGSDAGSGNGGGSGMFSSFFNLSIQKMVLLLAMIAFVISVGTVAILLWKSKSSQKWPPETAKCPDRMVLNSEGTSCSDPYGIYTGTIASDSADNCKNYNTIKGITTYSGVSGDGYIPWEGILDGKASKSASLKCL